MHDGSIEPFKEVFHHYNKGGEIHSNKSEFIQGLNLTSDEKQDLVNFLESLSDETFIENPNFRN